MHTLSLSRCPTVFFFISLPGYSSPLLSLALYVSMYEGTGKNDTRDDDDDDDVHRPVDGDVLQAAR